MQRLDELPVALADLESLQSAAIDEATRILVGRRILPLYGPLKPGTIWVRRHEFHNHPSGRVAAFEEARDPEPLTAGWAAYTRVPVLFRDFALDSRELSAFRDAGNPLDPSIAARAAHAVADAEDTLVFYGDDELKIDGLINVEGNHRLDLSDWDQGGAAYIDVVRAIELLLQSGHHGPYGMACAFDRYHTLIRVHQSGLTALDQVSRVLLAGVYPSLALEPGTVVIVQGGLLRADLAVVQDLAVDYLDSDGSQHVFRVWEALIPRIKQGNAIVVFRKG